MGNIYHEIPIGDVDGANKDFTTASTYITGTVRVYVRGLEQKRLDDFADLVPNIVTLTEAPIGGINPDDIWVHYET